MAGYADIKTTFTSDLPDVALSNYKKLWKHDMAVCLVYFNSAKSKRLLMNYFYMLEKLKLANIPTYTLELYYDQPEIKNAFHVKGESFLFHKERLCRLIEKKVSWIYQKIVFMDADIVFNDPNWYSEVSQLLNKHDVVQPFTTAMWSDITYTEALQTRSTVLLAEKGGKYDPTLHPGFAWAFKRSWFRKVGFFDYGITGSGDTLSSAAWLDLKFPAGYLQPALKPTFDEFCKLPKPRITHASGTITHLWHGSKQNRKYVERHAILKGIADIRKIVRVSKAGVFELLDPEVNNKLKLYFVEREDDGF
jgi:hypothetical protein